MPRVIIFVMFYYEITSFDISNAHSLAVVGLRQIYMNSPTLNLDEVIECEAATEAPKSASIKKRRLCVLCIIEHSHSPYGKVFRYAV